MKALLISAILASLATAEPVIWTGNNAEDLEQSTLALTPKLRQQTALVGRLGLAETRVAVIVGESGHLISPYLPSVDGQDSPYLLYRPDGSRVELTIVEEKPKRSLAVLKLEEGFPGVPPLQITALTEHTVIVPSCAPIAAIGEPVSLLTDHLKYAPAEDAPVFHLNQALHFPGSAVFDPSGGLLGFTLEPEPISEGTDVLTITKAITEISALKDLLPDLSTPTLPEFPKAPLLTKEEIKELNAGEITEVREQAGTRYLPNPLPCVLVFNEGKPLTNSAIGTIVRSDGLILSKASELGSSLNVRYAGQNFPGVLLATDEETDLALIAIAATGLPAVSWSTASPTPGQTMIAPVLLKENTEEMVSEQTSYLGTFSHLLPANTPTVHATSQVTSTGFITEQTDTALVVAALTKDTPAFQSGLAPGDTIVAIDDQAITTRHALTTLLDTHRVGDEVSLKISRAGAEQTFKIKLISPNLIPPATGVSLTSGLVMIPSVRRSPFPGVLVHTTPLNSWDCGSPIFNRKGEALGLNIAAVSAGRTLALLPKDIQAALARMLPSSRTF